MSGVTQTGRPAIIGFTQPEEITMAITDEVFISYSHDSIDHMERVRQLADKLRSEGVDCDIDQYEETPPEGWPRWMGRKINDSKFVLAVCTEPYYKRVEGKEEKGKGLGATWEGGAIVNNLYELGGDNVKFIPVIFDFSDRHFIPAPLRPTTYYNLAKQSGYDDLYRRLIGQPKVKRPELGKLKLPIHEAPQPLPEREIKSSPAMLLMSPIDLDLWNAAKWSATFFIGGDSMLPTLGIAYKKEAEARKIFEGWRERFGKTDVNEELRISIIDGPIEGDDDDNGYSVHISLNPDAVHERMKSYGMDGDSDIFMMVSRINRMNPPDGLKNLDRFKAEFAKHKQYTLAPGVVSEDGTQLKPMLDLGIVKRSVIFKHSSEVDINDIDVAVTKSGLKKRGMNHWTNPSSPRKPKENQRTNT